MHEIPLIIEPDPDDPGCAEVLVDGTIAVRPCRFQANWLSDFPAAAWAVTRLPVPE